MPHPLHLRAKQLGFPINSAATASTPAGILNGVSITAGGSDVQGSLGALLADFDGDTRRSVFIARASVFASISTNYPRVSLGSNVAKSVCTG
jgi:hypothetical protein